MEAELDLRSFRDERLYIKGRFCEKPHAVVKAERGFESDFREKSPETHRSGEPVKNPVKGLA